MWYIALIDIFFLELCICFQLSQLTNLLSTLWSTIVFINSTVCSLLITLSESTSQPIPKSRSKTLVSSVSYLTIFLKMPLSFALANSCDEILFLLWALWVFSHSFLLHERWKLIVNLTKVLPRKLLNELSSPSSVKDYLTRSFSA